MTTPFAILGTLQLPGGPTLPVEPLPFGLSASFESKAEYELNLSSTAGSQAVPFGTIPAAGVKALLVTYDPVVAAPPVQLTLNGSSVPLELSTGGFLLLASPTPVAGVISLAIAHTAAARVRVWLLG